MTRTTEQIEKEAQEAVEDRMRRLRRVQHMDRQVAAAVPGLALTGWGSYTTRDGETEPPRITLYVDPAGGRHLSLHMNFSPEEARALAAGLVRLADTVAPLPAVNEGPAPRCGGCGHGVAQHDPSPHRSCRICPCVSFRGPLPLPPLGCGDWAGDARCGDPGVLCPDCRESLRALETP